MSTECFLLLMAFQIKHFFADYPLQNGYMLRKTAPDWGFFLPLLAHASVHGAITFGLVFNWTIDLSLSFEMAFFDLISHFIIDRIKASPRMLGRYNDPKASSFWICLGWDQLAHHAINICIVQYVISK